MGFLRHSQLLVPDRKHENRLKKLALRGFAVNGSPGGSKVGNGRELFHSENPELSSLFSDHTLVDPVVQEGRDRRPVGAGKIGQDLVGET